MAWKFADEVLGDSTATQRGIARAVLLGGCPNDWKRRIRPLRVDEIIAQGLKDAVIADKLAVCWIRGVPPYSATLDVTKKHIAWRKEAIEDAVLTRRGEPIAGRLHARIMFGVTSREDFDWLAERIDDCLSIAADIGIIDVPVVEGVMAGFALSSVQRTEILIWGECRDA